jgi:ubiquinone/menaquinone biosynthesis C-methylase UbiE
MSSLAVIFVVLLVILVLVRILSPRIYDHVIVSMTRTWYEEFLKLKVEKGNRVLDIGIGTASALCENASIVKEKRLNIMGVDYEKRYVEYSKGVIKDSGLEDRVRTVHASVYDPELKKLLGEESFDRVYFSGSISLMPDPAEALRVCAKLLRHKSGRIVITQTFQNRSFFCFHRIKPLLKYITTIDFGQLVFHRDIKNIIDKANMKIVYDRPISGSIDNMWQTARMIVLEPSFG